MPRSAALALAGCDLPEYAVHRCLATLAGGDEVQRASDAWVDEHGPVRPGTAAVTTAGRMPARMIVHVRHQFAHLQLQVRIRRVFRLEALLDELAGELEAARQDKLAWVAYPKGKQLGTDLDRDSLHVRLVLAQAASDEARPAAEIEFEPARRKPSMARADSSASSA